MQAAACHLDPGAPRRILKTHIKMPAMPASVGITPSIRGHPASVPRIRTPINWRPPNHATDSCCASGANRYHGPANTTTTIAGSQNEKRRARRHLRLSIFFFQAEDGIRDYKVTGVQTCALPILFFRLLSGTADRHHTGECEK